MQHQAQGPMPTLITFCSHFIRIKRSHYYLNLQPAFTLSCLTWTTASCLRLGQTPRAKEFGGRNCKEFFLQTLHSCPPFQVTSRTLQPLIHKNTANLLRHFALFLWIGLVRTLVLSEPSSSTRKSGISKSGILNLCLLLKSFHTHSTAKPSLTILGKPLQSPCFTPLFIALSLLAVISC